MLFLIIHLIIENDKYLTEIHTFHKAAEGEKDMFRVIIAGCRDFFDYDVVRDYADKMLAAIEDDIQIVSGHASGVDKLGERYARERGYDVALYPAEWNKYGAAAGPKRNREMAKNADALIAYWDGGSRGTKNMIEEAKAKGLKVRIKYVNENK